MIALIVIYYLFIDVLVASSKFNFPEMTPSHIAIFSGGPSAKTTSPLLLIKNEGSLT
jgi:hypothetical protein